MRFTGNIIVRFKKSVLEPQGKAIELSLKEQGYQDIEQIRVGKWIEVSIDAKDRDEAKRKIEEIAEKVLYNPVMETCEVQLELDGK